MALVIGVEKGDAFYLNDTRVVVTEIINEQKFVIEVDTPTMIFKHTITGDRAAVLKPQDWSGDVKISAGLRGSDTIARVVIDAPRQVGVLRGSLYHKSKAAEA